MYSMYLYHAHVYIHTHRHETDSYTRIWRLSKGRETNNCGHGSRGVRKQQWLCWRDQQEFTRHTHTRATHLCIQVHVYMLISIYTHARTYTHILKFSHAFTNRLSLSSLHTFRLAADVKMFWYFLLQAWDIAAISQHDSLSNNIFIQLAKRRE